jgi:sugar (pentulose or hexulose) kinase
LSTVQSALRPVHQTPWARLFAEVADALGATSDAAAVFTTLFTAALERAPDCAGLMAYNYLSGEPITDLNEGRPLFVRSPDSRFDLATFMRTQLYAALATLRIGMDVLASEDVQLEKMFAHGGLFTTKGVAQRFLAGALNTPVSVGDVAAEGGAWGMAVLAEFAAQLSTNRSLADHLAQTVFSTVALDTVMPNPDDVSGFNSFIERYITMLPVERAAQIYG